MTIAKIVPSIEQIRFHAQAALNGFETLDPETAAECAKGELRTLLRYLDFPEWKDAIVVVDCSGDGAVFEVVPARPTQEREK